jgi:Bacterial protein of unknown function (DUF899)
MLRAWPPVGPSRAGLRVVYVTLRPADRRGDGSFAALKQPANHLGTHRAGGGEGRDAGDTGGGDGPGADRAIRFLVNNIGHLAHLCARDTALAPVARAPLATIEPFKKRTGWALPWYSSLGCAYNDDFHVTLDEAVALVEYNSRDKATHKQAGMPWFSSGELDGVGVFRHDGDNI